MASKGESKETQQTELSRSTSSEFNFELWARQVRPQLLAALQKRGAR